ncbi:MAG: phosphoribosylaminoimidazolesuccinocarboxamide synthase [Pseudohongiella nitratireducens]|nr:phosphoribosylaminoimidazolesuccinocarboxamide synthase [Pseudohongiella nitratireducens]MDF1622673.1 phosphoribosylaminoimidazolesuccinocarboxamide synthase [Pseudohongiella nitratireducens]
MSTADSVLAINDDLPIKTGLPVHSGKVRSVYWLTDRDSRRLIKEKQYPVAEDTPLAIMIISDRLSAFDCIWHAEGGLNGVPGKGAALNAIAAHWFERFRESGLARSHILDIPHPFVWIVQKARPVKVEAIARQYITGSMWRAYAKGEREFCGIRLPDGLERDQKLDDLLITPSTKGILTGLKGVPEADDVNISRQNIEDNLAGFGFNSPADIDHYERLLKEGFQVISDDLAKQDQVFVDTKFEFGYVTNDKGQQELIYMDEVGTPDSSRIWDGPAYRDGKIVEQSKEAFRQFLLGHFADPDVLLDKNRMPERSALARDTALPASAMLDVSKTYLNIAEKITGHPISVPDNPREEIIQVLADNYQLIRT